MIKSFQAYADALILHGRTPPNVFSPNEPVLCLAKMLKSDVSPVKELTLAHGDVYIFLLFFAEALRAA
jgi:hypothetical protein